MKKFILLSLLPLLIGTSFACTPPMFIQAQKNHTEITYCKSLRTLLIDRTKSDIFRDVLTDFVNAKCYKYFNS